MSYELKGEIINWIKVNGEGKCLGWGGVGLGIKYFRNVNEKDNCRNDFRYKRRRWNIDGRNGINYVKIDWEISYR